jgi:cytolysin-activating lysine-acyltransferase
MYESYNANYQEKETAMQDTSSQKPQSVDHTVADVFGQITWLMTQSKDHKGFLLSDLEWLVMPAIMLKQFRIFYQEGQPVGAALWALVSDEVEARLKAGPKRLQLQDWQSGDTMFLVELVAPFGGQDEMLESIKA